MSLYFTAPPDELPLADTEESFKAYRKVPAITLYTLRYTLKKDTHN